MSSGAASAAREARLEALARVYRVPLLRYFARRGVSPDGLDDCVQDVFLRLSRADEHAIENAEAYLFTVASAVVIDRSRRQKVRHGNAHVSLDGLDLPEGVPGPQRVLEGKEALKRLGDLLQELPTKTREIFLLNRLEGLTYTQLAARYGITVKGIEKQMSRALAHIRRGLPDDI